MPIEILECGLKRIGVLARHDVNQLMLKEKIKNNWE
jgi:hypothetical protein